MKQVLQHVRSGRLEVAEVPEPLLRGGGLLVRNAASLISAGTEKMVIDFAAKSMVGKARERPDLVRQVLDKLKKDGIGPTVRGVLSRLDQPIPLGYSCAGIVEEVGRGAEEFSVGDRVACAGMGYASHAGVVFVPKNLTARVPENVSFEDAAYVTLGAIALQGVRVADVRLGETVAVIGLGLLGQLTVQLLRAAGARVMGIDLDPEKAARVLALGAEAGVARGDDVRSAVNAMTGGAGVDAVIVAAAADSNDPIELAGEISRDRGRVSVVGAVRMDVPRKPYYDKELELRVSRSYGPGRYDPSYEEQGHDYPIGYVRWTERRNMEEFLRLVSAGQVTPSGLTSHRFAVEQAGQAYDIVTGRQKEAFTGIVLTYLQAPPTADRRVVRTAERGSLPGSVGVGFIGAGNFARTVLLPQFKRAHGVDLIGIATATGVSAKGASEKYGFRYATTDVAALLADSSIHAVVIATRHGSHASYAAAALRAGKAVFLEKPLAVDEGGLADVMSAQTESGGLLTVGFNRRFSPLATKLKEAFSAGVPLAISYRINAGPVPAGSWLHDPADGGGRIIGEVCHFIDFAQFLTDAYPVESYAHALGGASGVLHDTVAVVLRFDDGSVANISYFATGDKTFPKERVEVYGGGSVAVFDDFRDLMVSKNGRRARQRRLSQDKGYELEVVTFLRAVREGGRPPIDIASLAATTRATFDIEESLRTGSPVRRGSGSERAR